MKITTASHNLSEAWLSAVRAGKIVNEFEMPDQHRVQFGLSVEDGELAYFAKNLTTALPIPARGTPIKKSYLNLQGGSRRWSWRER